MKILTITGTRPELIRLSVILKKLDDICDHIHVYTNQNADPNLSTIFFQDLGLRKPDYTLGDTKSLDMFVGNAIMALGFILNKEKPDKVLILGDTNSALTAIICAKMGYPVYHMEAGNRCYDGVVPEETNRVIVDSCSYMNLPYTKNSYDNLINEGYHKNRVFRIGNPIHEVLLHYAKQIGESRIMVKHGLSPDNEDAYTVFALLSFHRTENVDSPKIARQVMEAMGKLNMPVIFPLHPRTKDQFKKNGIEIPENVITIPPIGFFDFVKLERRARVIFTDSGTVPEEAMLFGVPCIVLRNTTERQELMETGSFILAGTKTNDILQAYDSINNMEQTWSIPKDYSKENVSDTVIRILMGQTPCITRKGHDEY